jgi:hypothetical protein
VPKGKSKSKVKVISSSGVAGWTSLRGARRLMDQGLAELKNGLLVMKESAPQFRYGTVRYQTSSRVAGPMELPFRPCWLNSKAAVLRFPGEQAR